MPNPPPRSLVRYFKYSHLPENLQAVSKHFYNLASMIDDMAAVDPREKQVALRKLLEAKDAAVRSVVPDRKD